MFGTLEDRLGRAILRAALIAGCSALATGLAEWGIEYLQTKVPKPQEKKKEDTK